METCNALYTSRQRRFADGSLVDVTTEAHQARFVVPVALSGELYADVCDLTGEYVLSGDTAESRLWSLLHYARAHASNHLDESAFSFSLYLPVEDRTVLHLRLWLHAGDGLEDVITISREDEPC